jgi:hypothetical protein
MLDGDERVAVAAIPWDGRPVGAERAGLSGGGPA